MNEKRKQTTIKFIQLPHVQARPPQEITSENAVHQVTVIVNANKKETPAIKMKVPKIKMILKLRTSVLNKMTMLSWDMKKLLTESQ